MNTACKTVAAAHDLSGVGRCALTVAIPVISAMGAQVCPIPTAVLSAHTAFDDFCVKSLTDFMENELAAWGRMGLKFDSIYTGYLGSPQQARAIIDFMRAQKDALKLVDPVMGDDGSLYGGITDEMASAMREMCREATLITPNMTEYAFLTGEKYSLAPRSRDEIDRMLHALGAKSAVITSVPVEGGMVNAYIDASGETGIVDVEALPRHYPGTGDIFASVLCGALLRGQSLREAVELAGGYITETIRISMDVPTHVNYGVQLERTLYMLTGDL